MEGSGDFMLFEFHPNIKIVKFIKFCMCVFETESFFYFLFLFFNKVILILGFFLLFLK